MAASVSLQAAPGGPTPQCRNLLFGPPNSFCSLCVRVLLCFLLVIAVSGSSSSHLIQIVKKAHYSQYWTNASTTLDASTAIEGCGALACSLNLDWQKKLVVLPAGGLISFSNLVLENAVLDVPTNSPTPDQYLDLPPNLFLPSFISASRGLVLLTNVTVVTDCDTILSYSRLLHSKYTNYETALNDSPSNHTMQQDNLLWEHSFQVLPGKLHVNAWNATLVTSINTTFTCLPPSRVSTASNNVDFPVLPLAIDKAVNSDGLRLLIGVLPSFANSIIISIQANVSLVDAGVWASSLGPASIVVNTTLAGLPWRETVLDVQDRRGIFDMKGSATLTLHNLVVINPSFGPPVFAPWNYMPQMWFVHPYQNKITSLFGIPGGISQFVVRTCILEDVADIWWYFNVWAGKALAPIGTDSNSFFMLNYWDQFNGTTVGGAFGGTRFAAAFYYIKVNTTSYYYVYVRPGASRKYLGLRNSSGINELTNYQVVPLNAVRAAWNSSTLISGLKELLALELPNVALWVMTSIKLRDAQQLAMVVDLSITKPIVVGYGGGGQVMDFDGQVITLRSIRTANGVVSSLVFINLAITENRGDWGLLQSSVMSLSSVDNVMWSCRHLVLVVSQDEVRFLQSWGQTLLGLTPTVSSNDSDTLVYNTLRAFGYSGTNITITSRCPVGFVCFPTNITYEQLVSFYVHGNATKDHNQFLHDETVVDAGNATSPATLQLSSNVDSSPDQSHGTTIAIIVSCALGIPLVILALAAAIVFCMSKSNQRNQNNTSSKLSMSSQVHVPLFQMLRKKTSCSSQRSLARVLETDNSMHLTSTTAANDSKNDAQLVSIPSNITESWGFVRPIRGEGMVGNETYLQRGGAVDKCEDGGDGVLDSLAAQFGEARASQTRTAKGMALVSAMVSKLTSIKDENLCLQELIGRGGAGAVYKAAWRGLPVAVKMLLLPGGDVSLLERAAREVAMLLKMHHRNVVTVYSYQVRLLSCNDHYESNNATYPSSSVMLPPGMDLKVLIIQEYCNGGTLQAAIDEGHLGVRRQNVGIADFDELHSQQTRALNVAIKIARGMSHVHQRNIVHGDLTPGNVLLHFLPPRDNRHDQEHAASGDACFEVKVADFGMAVGLGVGQTHVTRSIQGTTHYIAPEVFLDNCTSKPADVYAFGVILWELMHGTPPWRSKPNADDQEFVDDIPTSTSCTTCTMVPPTDPSCPPPVSDLICACTNLEPGLRPTLPEVLATLMRAKEELGYANMSDGGEDSLESECHDLDPSLLLDDFSISNSKITFFALKKAETDLAIRRPHSTSHLAGCDPSQLPEMSGV